MQHNFMVAEQSEQRRLALACVSVGCVFVLTAQETCWMEQRGMKQFYFGTSGFACGRLLPWASNRDEDYGTD